MQQLDLNLLSALDALLDEGSVVGAAARMGLSASAMSRTLGRLRCATGDPLLVKAGRGLVPTPRALAMRARVRASLTEVQSLLRPPEDTDPRHLRRTLSIRVDDAVTAILGPPLLNAAAREVPHIGFMFQAEGDEEVDALRDGRVDLDIGVQGPLGPELRTRALLRDRRVVLVRRGKSTRRRMGLAEFARREHVDVSRRGRRRGPIDEALSQKGLTRFVRTVVPNQLSAAMLVAQSNAISLVSQHFAASIRSLLPVEAVAAPAPLAQATVALAWHPRFDADPAHRWLRETLVALARGLPHR